MGKKALRRDFYMEIRRTLYRFLSIFLIVVLGVAFFSGIRATDPDMRLSADAFYDKSNLMDIRILGDLGLTNADLEEVRSVEGVKEVVPGYFCDVQWKKENDVRNVHLMSLTEPVNCVTVTQGRLPRESGECLMDEQMAEAAGTKVGDTIHLQSGDEEKLSEKVHGEEYVVVGLGSSPLYLSLERGTTSIGDGSLDGFLFLMSEDFAIEAYTELVLTVEGAEEEICHTDDYDDLVDQVQDRLEDIAGERCKIRYAEVKEEAEEKISDGKADIADAKQKLADAGQKITDGEVKIADAKEKIISHEKDIADAKKKVSDADQEIADGKQKIADGWKEYQNGVEQAVDGMDQLKEAEQQLTDARAQVSSGYAQIDGGLDGISKGLAQLDAQEQALEGMELSEEERAAALSRIDASRQELNAQAAALQEQRAGLDAQAALLDEKEQEWKQGYEEIRKALDQLEEARETLEEKEKELEDGEQKLKDAKKELSDGEKKIADAKVTLADGEAELEDGKREFEEKSADAEADIADGEQKIADAEEALSDLDEPEWYVLDRNTLETYVEYGQNADRIGAIGKVFPAIFFLVAALVCLTTMTRMVEEQRTQIGTIKALGYERRDIAGKYVCYAFLASALGSVLGCFVGQKLLPYVIIQAYKILYNNLPDVLTPMNVRYSLTASGLAVLCTVLAALCACWRELRSVPAVLMRPEPPKAGKRVFLERVRFLWKRLNFSQKSTVRNLMRYKKRFFMTIFGIGGCMALLLVGFGVRDSIVCIGDVEFGEIRNYDAVVTIDKDASKEEILELQDTLSADERINGTLRALEAAVDTGSDRTDGERSAYLIVPSEKERLGEFIILRDRASQNPLSLSDDGVIITEKLAKLLSVEPGDEIWVEDEDLGRRNVKVAAVTENYFLHYIYMSEELYESVFGAEPEEQAIFLDNTSDEGTFEDKMGEEYMRNPAVDAFTFVSGTSERVRDMLKSMDTLIFVLVISAGLLAFVVLFNLNNINITERRRELATLRVLGFYHEEVSQYVFRENIVLTLIGAAVGAVLGVILHRFVILTAEIDTMMFGRQISWQSYVYSILLTILFSGIVNLGMHFSLKKINMVESLKSVE